MKIPQLDKGYEPAQVEADLYRFWIDQKLFEADAEADGPPFSMVIPPPNVTGTLHMGHALNTTLQDILWRYYKMKGYNALWVPGTDHAGIATQNVVERMLAQEGLNRHQLGREKFVEKVWEWREKFGGIIINQLKRLGAACDWSRERFTFDEGLSIAVREDLRLGLEYEIRSYASAVYKKADGTESNPWLSSSAFHVGSEYTPLSWLALRVGVRGQAEVFEQQGNPIVGEPVSYSIYSAGCGVSYGGVRLNVTYEYASLKYQDMWQTNVNLNNETRHSFIADVSYEIPWMQ